MHRILTQTHNTRISLLSHVSGSLRIISSLCIYTIAIQDLSTTIEILMVLNHTPDINHMEIMRESCVVTANAVYQT